jgi:hypothetical protein
MEDIVYLGAVTIVAAIFVAIAHAVPTNKEM